MKAIILAGGQGTRLRPLTYSIPKPLLPIGRKPILEVIIERIREYDFRDIILSVQYKAELIRAYFRDGTNLNVKITYSQETRPLGTAGPIKLVEHLLDSQPFMVMNSDILTDLDFGRMYKAHLSNSAELTVATTVHAVTLPYGVVDLRDGRIASIREKPTIDFLINAGIYIVSPSALDAIPAGKFFDMPDLIQTLISRGRKVETYLINGEWHDLGIMENYEKANHSASSEE